MKDVLYCHQHTVTMDEIPMRKREEKKNTRRFFVDFLALLRGISHQGQKRKSKNLCLLQTVSLSCAVTIQRVFLIATLS